MSEEQKDPKEATQGQTHGADRASKMMDNMFKGLKQFGHVAREKAEEYGKIASDKAEELTKIGKIKLDIHQLNRSRTKALADLGELVFKLHQEDDLKGVGKNKDYQTLLESIASLNEQIAAKEALEAATEESHHKTETPAK